MFAVAFEVLPSENGYQRYLDIAAALRPKLDLIDGFVSIERFRSLTHPGWILSLSLWRDEAALVQWRRDGEHHAAQSEGRTRVFDDYRIRVVDMTEQAWDSQGAAIGLQMCAENEDIPCKRFQSLVNADKQVALLEFENDRAAQQWHAARSSAPANASDRLCGRVLRDYGLFERTQAPQQFPPALARG